MNLLPARDYIILGMIGNTPGISHTTIASQYGVKRESASIGQALSTLKERRYIFKDRKTVGTRSAFYITDHGRRVLDAVNALELVQ